MNSNPLRGTVDLFMQGDNESLLPIFLPSNFCLLVRHSCLRVLYHLSMQGRHPPTARGEILSTLHAFFAYHRILHLFLK